MTRLVILSILAACFVAPYLGAPGYSRETRLALTRNAVPAGYESEVATPSGAPDDHSSAGFGATRQALRGAPQTAPYAVEKFGGPSNMAAGPTASTDATAAGGALNASAPLAAVTRQGLVSWVAPRYGRYYLALPYPRGTRATICGIGGCVTRTSTDYGPSQRIHPDRIADLSAVDFEYVCAMPRRFGLCNAVLTILKRGSGPAPRAVPTAPATDLEGTE